MMSDKGIKSIGIVVNDEGDEIKLGYDEWLVVFNALKPIFEPAKEYISPFRPHIRDDFYGPLTSPDPLIGPGLVPYNPYPLFNPPYVWCSGDGSYQVGDVTVTYKDD